MLLAEELHFGRAASRAHLSPAAFSEQVARLESELGVRLFERSSRRVAPTAAGTVAIAQARAVLDAVETLRREVSVHATPAATRLRLGLAAASIDLTAAVLRRFALDHPEVTVHAQQFDFGDPSAGLTSGQSEAALVWGPLTTTGLQVRRLRRESMTVMVAADHPLAGKDEVRMADLAGETWCDTPTDDPVWRATWIPAPAGRLTDVGRTTDGLLELVAAGRGITFVPLSISERLSIPSVRFVPVADGPTCTVAVAVPDRPTPAARAFARTALQVARDRTRTGGAPPDPSAEG